MYNSKKLLVFYNLFKTELNSDGSSIHLNSFLKRIPISLLKKIYKKNYKILYSFFLASKSILNRYFSYKSFFTKIKISKNIQSIFAFNINFICFLYMYIFWKVGYLVKMYKKELIFYKHLFFLYIVYIYLANQLLYFKYSIISMPNKICRKTVLRSPHIDKRSREQFERITRHTFINTPFFFYNISGIAKVYDSVGVEVIQRITLKR